MSAGYNNLQKPDISMAELLCTKLCHDITGPIGAVSNGAEFLEGADDGEILAQAVDLIKSSARQAVVRIQLFRLSYGVVRGDGNVDFEQIKSIAADYFEASKITLWWDLAENTAMPRVWGKLLLNMLLASSELLLRGGIMKIACRNDGGIISLTVSVSAEKMKDASDIKRIICGDGDGEMDAKNVQHYMLLALIKELGGVAECNFSDSECVISVRSSNG